MREMSILDIINKKFSDLIPIKYLDIQFFSGIETGLDDAFIIDGYKKNELIAADKNNKHILKPFLSMQDIKRYKTVYTDKWIISIHGGYSEKNGQIHKAVEIDQYPDIRKHFIESDPEYIERTKNPYHFKKNPPLDIFKKEKILWSKNALTQQFNYEECEYLIDHSCNILISGSINLKYILAILNSAIFYYQCKSISMEMRKQRYIFKYIEALELVSIPVVNNDQQEPLIVLVDFIHYSYKHKIKDPSGSIEVVQRFEELMDMLVFGLYFPEQMKAKDCYINDDILAYLPELPMIPSEEELIQEISNVYQGLKYDSVIEPARLRYKLVNEIKTILGSNN
jgi:adenine-specific DNA-methyltransferase